MPGQIRIGTSGWNYDHWRGPFYPGDLPRHRWFEYYSQDFDTVEINNTFYQQPDNETFDHWRAQAPAGFLYAVKANRYLTHMKKLKDPREPLERFLHGATRLKGRLGPILYQLPPHWNRNLERLESFARVLPAEFTHVVEFRQRDWLSDDTYKLLSEYNVSLCVHDMLRRHPRRVTGSIVYVRFHGAGKTRGGKYRPSRLRSWAGWILEQARQRDVFVYFNNDECAYAVRNAREMRDICAG
jgi:uncharacterized protein YecE (DUF72 family)